MNTDLMKPEPMTKDQLEDIKKEIKKTYLYIKPFSSAMLIWKAGRWVTFFHLKYFLLWFVVLLKDQNIRALFALQILDLI